MKIMVDSANVKIEGDKAYIELDTEKLVDLMSKDEVELSTLSPGDKFMIGDDWFIVLEHTYGGTRVITDRFVYPEKTFGDSPDWRKSTIRYELHDIYLQKITAAVGAGNIIPMVRDLTSLDGLDDYGTCSDVVSLLTVAEYAKYHKILGLKSCYDAAWWTITPESTPSNGYSCNVCCVDSEGTVGRDHCDFTNGVRPFLMLNSSVLVLVNHG